MTDEFTIATYYRTRAYDGDDYATQVAATLAYGHIDMVPAYDAQYYETFPLRDLQMARRHYGLASTAVWPIGSKKPTPVDMYFVDQIIIRKDIEQRRTRRVTQELLLSVFDKEFDTSVGRPAQYTGGILQLKDDGFDEISAGEDYLDDVEMFLPEEYLPKRDDWFEDDHSSVLTEKALDESPNSQRQQVQISLARSEEPVSQTVSPLPLELLKIAMSYVPSSFKVSKNFVPYNVMTVESRLAQMLTLAFNPYTLDTTATNIGQETQDILVDFPESYSFIDELEQSQDYRLTILAHRVKQARSPDEAFREAMIEKFGVGMLSVKIPGGTALILDYKTVNMRAVGVYENSALGDCEPDHFISHFMGLQPGRRTTTYSSGLLTLLTREHAMRNGLFNYLGQWDITRATGPLRSGYSGGCILDPDGNLIGMNVLHGRAYMSCLWSWKNQTWYVRDLAGGDWEAYDSQHRSMSAATKKKFAGLMLDTGTCMCDQNCCREHYFQIRDEEFDPQIPFETSYTYAYHDNLDPCSCGGCNQFFEADLERRPPHFWNPEKFLVASYTAERHASFLRGLDSKSRYKWQEYFVENPWETFSSACQHNFLRQQVGGEVFRKYIGPQWGDDDTPIQL